MDATTDLGRELRAREERKRKEQEFVDKQAEELQAAGVTSIINSYGTEDIDNIDRLWWRVLNKMVDDYMIK